MSWLDHLEEQGLSYLSLKGLDDISFGLKYMNFSRIDVQNFLILHYHHSEHNISTAFGN